jgi:transposase
MSLQAKPGSRVPEETARVARAAFPKGNPYLTVHDELDTSYPASLRAALFPTRGQPAEAPGQLVLVTVLQCAKGLSDRPARGRGHAQSD